MTAPLKTSEGRDIAEAMRAIGACAKAAARTLALAPSAQKDAALAAMANAIRARTQKILAANSEDLADARAGGATEAFLDRLALDAKRIEAMAAGVELVRQLPDPVGTLTDTWTRPNGMRIERVRVPLGVVGVIFESRPNVTADAGALCLKAGNAVILRGGSEGFRSSRAIHAALAAGLEQAGLPQAAIALVPTRDRAAVGLMLSGLDGTIDVIVPRGGKGLVGRVQAEARVPVFAHLEGVCHVYVDKAADLAMAKNIVLNAKMRRTGVCGAAETLLVDRAGTAQLLEPLVAVQLVDGVDEAIAHIERYGSHHTDAIVTADGQAAEKFLAEVDSAIVLHNASTQFADGGEFGFGAEIGIATGRLHARGPVGTEQLCSFKYRVRGSGQIRP